MKLRLTREIHTQHLVLDEGLIGEPTLMIWDDEGRVVEVEMVFYGKPGLHMLRAADLENL